MGAFLFAPLKKFIYTAVVKRTFGEESRRDGGRIAYGGSFAAIDSDGVVPIMMQSKN